MAAGRELKPTLDVVTRATAHLLDAHAAAELRASRASSPAA